MIVTRKPPTTTGNRFHALRGVNVTFSGAKPTAPVKAPIQYRHLAIRGSAPISGPQGNMHLTPALHRGLQTGTLYPAPVTAMRQFATGHTVARTVGVGTVPIQTKPHGVPAFRGKTAKPYGGPPPTPLMLGQKKQIGRDTVRKAVYQPPQTLIPSVMQKLFRRG